MLYVRRGALLLLMLPREMDMGMEISLLSPAAVWTAIMGIVVVFVLIRARSQTDRFPPGPLPLPIIGNLHLLGALPHQSLALLAKRYGSVMYLRLGSIPTIVVSSAALAKEVLGTHDRVFASRPYSHAGKILFYDSRNLGLMPYGSHWRQLRRMYTVHLLSAKKIDLFAAIREEEISRMLQFLWNACKEERAVNLTGVASALAMSTIMRVVVSRNPYGTENAEMSNVCDLLEEAIRLLGVPVFRDFIPYLGWIDLKGYISRMKKVHKRLDLFVEGLINQRVQWRKEIDCHVPNDFLDVLLSTSDDESGTRLSNDAVKASVLELLSAGTDTASVSIEWAMAELLRKPVVLKRAQEELDSVIGQTRNVRLSDITQLEFLQAIVKETFRLHPPAPLLVARQSMEACEVAGYVIPENTRVLVNAWAIGRDEAAWARPQEFYPERFMGSTMDVRGQDFEMSPFGSGRRGCPGLSLGLSMVQLGVASLVHAFEWQQLPKDVPPDMSESMGLTAHRASPLIVLPKARGVPIALH